MAVARCKSLEAPGGDVPQHHVLGHPAAQQSHDVLEQLVAGAEHLILLGQGDGHTAGLASGHDGDLMDRIMGGQGVHGDGVPGLVIGGELPGVGGDHLALLLRACDDLDGGLVEVLHGDAGLILPAASRAPSFIRFSRSAPVNPPVALARVARFTSSARGFFREWTFSTSVRPLMSGRPT